MFYDKSINDLPLRITPFSQSLSSFLAKYLVIYAMGAEKAGKTISE